MKGYWNDILEEEFQKPYMLELFAFLDKEYEKSTVYPSRKDIFRALKLTPFEEVQVVIIGQDPYHGEGQAHGLAFSVPEGQPRPPSLRNIFQEIGDEFKKKIPKEASDLTPWSKQGVLLLNTCLTVRANSPASHAGKGWEQLTDRLIQELSHQDRPLIFLLWGAFAKSKEILINKNRHIVLKSSHPSPFSADSGFFGCGHFAMANEYLKIWGRKEIDWVLE